MPPTRFHSLRLPRLDAASVFSLNVCGDDGHDTALAFAPRLPLLGAIPH